MSNPSKAWAMLTARGVRIGGTFGGIPDLTPSDIARMLDGLEKGPFLAGMAKESGDVSILGDLERCMWIETMRMADPLDLDGRPIKHRAWPSCHGQAYCRRMAGLAVFEFLVPRPEKCEHCDGKGWVKYLGQGVSCLYCGDATDGSTGGQKLSPARRAELAGIPLRSWKEGWDSRYELVHATIWTWHRIAMSHLRSRLLAHRKSA